MVNESVVLRTALNAAGVKQSELNMEARIHYSRVSNIVNATGKPASAEERRKISEVIGWPEEVLFPGPDEDACKRSLATILGIGKKHV